MHKIYKAGAMLFTENTLLAQAHRDTFVANNTKKGKLLRQGRDAASVGNTTAFGRVLSKNLRAELELKAQAEADEKARKEAEK